MVGECSKWSSGQKSRGMSVSVKRCDHFFATGYLAQFLQSFCSCVGVKVPAVLVDFKGKLDEFFLY